ncbi:MAG TPA: hypothetical protein VEV39_14395 [Gemmatimonadales bacterium]|nr:hypothetical protein [Gemmatimonadales bacterium]
MELQSPSGQRFKLNIEGYQFPEGPMGWHDRNWLNIRIAVTHPRGSWERSAPALLTEEVAKLASWFEQVFPIDAAAFLAAALDLRRQLAIFPERSGDDSER